MYSKYLGTPRTSTSIHGQIRNNLVSRSMQLNIFYIVITVMVVTPLMLGYITTLYLPLTD